MMPSRRVLAIVSAIAFLCASVLVVARPPLAGAAGKTFIVTSTSDAFSDPEETCDATPSNCTLRQAMNAANLEANAGSTVIFRLELGDPGLVPPTGTPALNRAWIITPTIGLPNIEQNGTVIDGSSQTDWKGNTNNDGAEIIIHGGNVGDKGGFQVFSDGNTISGVGIAGFRGTGAPGQLKGVGIEISGKNNIVTGNYIGLTVSPTGGTTILANADAGMIIRGGDGNRIGGGNTTQTTEFNVISGNDGDGILINGGDNNIIAGNYIGTNATISAAIPNKGNGINIRFNARNNVIGNFESLDSARYRNYIAGNDAYGIQITDSKDNKVYGNFIGLDRFGLSKIPNGLGGIRIDGTSANSATGNIIGAAAPAANMRNYIAGDSGPGIQLNNFGTKSNTVVNTYIGVNTANGVPTGNANQLQNGVLLTDGASNNTIGGSQSDANVIGNIRGDAVRVAGKAGASPLRSRSNIIRGNIIGVGPNGTTQHGNSGSGIVLDTAVELTVIGGTAAQSNLIANNQLDGIRLAGSQVFSNTIQVNTIRDNTRNGIFLDGPRNTVVLGLADAPVAITGNTLDGISATNAVSTSVRYAAITENEDNGLSLSGGSDATLLDNRLNENGALGVLVTGAAQQVTLSANDVFTNTVAGVRVDGSNTRRVTLAGNRVSGNAYRGTPYTVEENGNGLGVVLDPKSDRPGSSTNANGDIDPPSGLQLRQDGRLTGRVFTDNVAGSCRGTPAPSCTVEVFAANPETLDGQGLWPLTTLTIGTPEFTANGYFTATLGVVPEQVVVAATDAEGNTSEFAVLTTDYGVDIEPPRTTNPAFPGQTVVYSHIVTNTGTVDLTDLSLAYTLQNLDWTAVTTPTAGTEFSLAAGASIPVTLTLTLPTGTAEGVRVPRTEATRLTVASTGIITATDFVTDTTVVGQKFVLEVEPPDRTVIALPNEKAPLDHVLKNSGNVTATLTLDIGTSRPGWTAEITPTAAFVLGPGEERTISGLVLVPDGTAEDLTTSAWITVTAEVEGSAGPPEIVAITDTVKAGELREAYITPKIGEPKDAGGLEVVSFPHTVTYVGFGSARFRLTAFSSLGSRIRLVAGAGGVTIDENGFFTLDTSPGVNRPVLNFLVEVTVADVQQVPTQDTITIYLTDADGNDIDFASDTINVVRRAIRTTYLPLTYRP